MALKPQTLPANYKLTARVNPSDEDSVYAYTVAVAGEDASITSHTGSKNPDEDDSVLYFKLNQPDTCDPNETASTSFMTSKFQVPDFKLKSPFLPTVTEKGCWKAPPGYYIYEGNPVLHKKIFQLFHYSLYPDYVNNWDYDGTISTTQGKADVWKYDQGNAKGRDTLVLSRSTGKPISYSTRFEETSQIELEDIDFTAYEEPEDVPKARLTDEEKEECFVMSKDYGGGNFSPCQECSDDLVQAAKEAFAEQVQIVSTGFQNAPPDAVPYPYPSTEKEYEFLGSEEEQEKANGLKSFLPGMVDRGMVPVRNQRNCGSCYSMAAAHTISSSYAQAQENPDSDFLVFSNQHFMNCLPLSFLLVGESGTTFPRDTGAGCWAGNPYKIIDMVVYEGGKLPLIEEEPYIGFQSHCDLDGKDNWVDTGMTGYSTINSIEEMKNALHFRGDVAIAYNGDTTSGDVIEDENIKMPPNDIELHEQAYLGEGISYPSGGTNHAVAIVGWGPCQVTHCKTGETIDDECWIMQNSWGPSAGYDGFYFVHTDLECDAGIISSGSAIIPLFDKVEVETKVDTSSGEVSQSQSYLFGLWLCSVANVALYAILLRL